MIPILRRGKLLARMHDGKAQQAQSIYRYITLLALDLFGRIIAMRIDAGPPFRRFSRLTIDDGGGGTGVSPSRGRRRDADAKLEVAESKVDELDRQIAAIDQVIAGAAQRPGEHGRQHHGRPEAGPG
jgi:hypothetical protein